MADLQRIRVGAPDPLDAPPPAWRRTHKHQRPRRRILPETTWMSLCLLQLVSILLQTPSLSVVAFAPTSQPSTTRFIRSPSTSTFPTIHNPHYRTSPPSPCSSSRSASASSAAALTALSMLPSPDETNLLVSTFFDHAHLISSGVLDVVNRLELPFYDLGKDLASSLDIGAGLSRNTGIVPEREMDMVLESLGYDLLVFLAASVVVTPLAKALNVTPILGYLCIGALLGPNGLDLFANSKAAIELGDIGIMFLLFSEGLEVTSSRLQKLVNYLPLGLAQISLVTGIITAALFSNLPELANQYIGLDPSILGMNPIEAVVLAMIGCLSTSAFIFPVLKERGWEDEESGEAATSILLLQDLMVAPLLVLLPYLAGDAATDYVAIGFLTAKATIGFGSVLALGSFLLRRIFALVAEAESSETFVALCLLVAAGMGVIAKYFGLTDTAGAFAAGVLLANTNYRAQIQADILPFKGILLGIFFMDAGSNFNIDLVMSQWPTIVSGSIALLLLKAATLGAATRVPVWMEPNRLPAADALRVSLLLAGGGEFAFVVLALAESLGLVTSTLSGIVTAIVLITMGLTPLLGDLAAAASEPLLGLKEEEVAKRMSGADGPTEVQVPLISNDAIVVCGYGEVGQHVLQVLGHGNGLKVRVQNNPMAPLSIVAFDLDPTLSKEGAISPGNGTLVLFGNAANPAVLHSSGIEDPSAIFVTYEDQVRVVSATARLRAAFPDTRIFARASTRRQVHELELAGATEVVVESDELPRSAPALLKKTWGGNLEETEDLPQHLTAEAANLAGISIGEVKELLELYKSMDQDGTGNVCPTEIEAVLERTGRSWIASDAEVKKVETWIEGALVGRPPVDALEFCRVYGSAPPYVKKAFGIRKRKSKGKKKKKTNGEVTNGVAVNGSASAATTSTLSNDASNNR